MFMINKCPWFWAFSYHFLDLPLIDRIGRLFRRATNSKHCKPFEQLVMSEQPEVIVTTHFLPNEVVGRLKRKHGLTTTLITCITDYYPHAFWRNQGIDLYVTPHESLAPRLQKLGVKKDQIYPLGIPIDPIFSVNQDQAQVRKKLGLDLNQFTILIASGGFGIGSFEELLFELDKIEGQLQILVVCGKNQKLEDELKEAVKRLKKNIKVYGYVQNMHELMEASDILISKSGGLTVTEAMAKGLPLIVTNPIPGQESSNCNFVVQNNAGKKADNPQQARSWITELQKNHSGLNTLKSNIKQLGRPNSAHNIWEVVEKYLGKED